MELVGAYFTARGRVARGIWFWRSLLLAAVALLVGLLAALVVGEAGQALVAAIYLWATSALAIQRLHDRGLSGRWLLIVLIPVFGPLWLLVQMLRRGAEGSNQYGPDPLARTGYLQVNTSRPGA
jgi:uncharacterized membrane protein YhaH (DUF805 family)